MTKGGYKFANHGIEQLWLSNGITNYPSEAYEPKFSAKSYWRSYHSLLMANGNCGIGLKNDHALARLTYENYPENFCLFKISTGRTGMELVNYGGASFQDVKENSLSLDIHMKFGSATTTKLTCIVMMEFEDSFEIAKTQHADRDVVVNYNY